MIHVEDVARSFRRVLEAPQGDVHNQAFNNGADHLNHQVIELAQIAVDDVPSSRMIVENRPSADQRTYRADFSKFAQTFGEPGVFVLGHQDVPARQHWLKMYKLGDGPIYTFYTPHHLRHLEVPFTVARAVLFGDAAVAPAKGHVVDVVTVAKRDLRAGETLDGIGFHLSYGVCENADVSRSQRLLPWVCRRAAGWFVTCPEMTGSPTTT